MVIPQPRSCPIGLSNSPSATYGRIAAREGGGWGREADGWKGRHDSGRAVHAGRLDTMVTRRTGLRRAVMNGWPVARQRRAHGARGAALVTSFIVGVAGCGVPIIASTVP